MHKPQVLDKMVFPAKDMRFVARVAQAVTVRLEVFQGRVEHVAVSAVRSTRGLRHDRAPMRCADPFLEAEVDACLMTRPVIFGSE